MNRLFLLFVMAFLSVAVIAQGDKSASDIVRVGDTMPAFTIHHDDGSRLESASLKGKVVLINFFATWCPPCQKELAEVQKTLWPKYRDNKNFKLMVIGREHNDKELASYNERKGFDFPLYPDKDRSVYGAFAKSLIPRTYLIGKDGKVIYTGSGFTQEEFEELLTKIDNALK